MKPCKPTTRLPSDLIGLLSCLIFLGVCALFAFVAYGFLDPL